MWSSVQEPPVTSQPGHLRLSSRSSLISTLPVAVFDNEVVPASLQSSIAPILRVAAEIQTNSPRVAHLCRSYALEKTERMDPNSNGRGVMQFKTILLQRLKRDEASSLASRVKETDALEIGSFYYEHYTRVLDKEEQADRHILLPVLFEVLCAVNISEEVKERKRRQ